MIATQIFPVSPTKNNRAYLDYMDQFRGFTILLIVFTHIYPSSFLPPWGWNVVQNASIFFIFISGFFFHYLYREAETTGAFFRRKVSRLVMPYLLSCLPGLLIVWRTTPELLNPGYFASTIFTGVGHYNDAHWYAPFIILIFAAYPLWRFLAQNNRALIVCTCMAMLIGLLTFRSQGNANPLISFIHFAGVFMAGMVASLYHEKLHLFLRQQFWTIVIIGFTAWALTMPFVGLSQAIDMETMLASGKLSVDLTMLAKLFLLLPLLAIFLRLSDSGQPLLLLKPFSRMSFGIFFWHYYSIYLIDQLATQMAINNAYWMIVFRPLLVILLVVIFLKLMSRVFPRLSPYLGVDAIPLRSA